MRSTINLCLLSCRASVLQSSRGSRRSWNRPSFQHSHFRASNGRKHAGKKTRRQIKALLQHSQGRWNTSRNKGKVTGCHPPLLHHLLQAQAPWPLGVTACLKVRVHVVGGSSGPCSCACDPSWSGSAGWARWSGATPQREARQCKRWTLGNHNKGLDYLPTC